VLCKKNKCILSTKSCILRQNVAINKKQEGENLTTFGKCFKCIQGNKVRMHSNPNILDKDVRMLINEYKPIRHKLTVRRKKLTKYKLRIKE
jgi:hypothetical protein